MLNEGSHAYPYQPYNGDIVREKEFKEAIEIHDIGAFSGTAAMLTAAQNYFISNPDKSVCQAFGLNGWYYIWQDKAAANSSRMLFFGTRDWGRGYLSGTQWKTEYINKPNRLWSNADTTASISTLNVQVDLSDYNYAIIEYKDVSSSSNTASHFAIIKVGTEGSGIFSSRYNGTSSVELLMREVDVSSTSVYFGTAYTMILQNGSPNLVSTSPLLIIPIAIYGTNNL